MGETLLTPAEYAVYGILCAAKHETGPDGARRMFRIQEHLDIPDCSPVVVEAALRHLIALGWVRQLPEVLGMIHFEALPLPC